MPVKREVAPGEYYYLSARGTAHLNIFREKTDYARLLFSLLYFQSPLVFKNIGRICGGFSEEGFPMDNDLVEIVLAERLIELLAFSIRPNGFHLLLKEGEKGGIAFYMHRILTGYTKFFQNKYRVSGHIFEGRYRAVHLKSDAEILRLSAYIHKGPSDIPLSKSSDADYPWSSFQDFVKGNRWGGLIAPELIASKFAGTFASNYNDYVKSLSYKELKNEFGALQVRRKIP
ncbi:MAG: hypothetical protein JO026_01290 [Patescibacteria group bacterium]|nr:hypothetical protein [Patescibacteria group bacterium]